MSRSKWITIVFRKQFGERQFKGRIVGLLEAGFSRCSGELRSASSRGVLRNGVGADSRKKYEYVE